MEERGRILAVDPGEKNIGIAISDPTGSIARPLMTLKHLSKLIDAAEIARLAKENQTIKIVVGMPTGVDGEQIPQSRHSLNLAEAVRSQSDLLVVLWDESGSTKDARSALIEMDVPVSKRGGHQDALAAAMILQSYLNAHSGNGDAHDAR